MTTEDKSNESRAKDPAENRLVSEPIAAPDAGASKSEAIAISEEKKATADGVSRKRTSKSPSKKRSPPKKKSKKSASAEGKPEDAKKSDGSGKSDSSAAAASASADQGKGKRRKKHRPGYSRYGRYIRRIVEKTCPDMSVSSSAVGILDSFVVDFVDRLGSQMRSIVADRKRQTLTCVAGVIAGNMLCDVSVSSDLSEAGKAAVNSYRACQSMASDEADCAK